MKTGIIAALFCLLFTGLSANQNPSSPETEKPKPRLAFENCPLVKNGATISLDSLQFLTGKMVVYDDVAKAPITGVKITGWIFLYISGRGEARMISHTSETLSPAAITLIQAMKCGDRIIIDGITAEGQSIGGRRNLAPFILTVCALPKKVENASEQLIVLPKKDADESPRKSLPRLAFENYPSVLNEAIIPLDSVPYLATGKLLVYNGDTKTSFADAKFLGCTIIIVPKTGEAVVISQATDVLSDFAVEKIKTLTCEDRIIFDNIKVDMGPTWCGGNGECRRNLAPVVITVCRLPKKE